MTEASVSAGLLLATAVFSSIKEPFYATETCLKVSCLDSTIKLNIKYQARVKISIRTRSVLIVNNNINILRTSPLANVRNFEDISTGMGCLPLKT